MHDFVRLEPFRNGCCMESVFKMALLLLLVIEMGGLMLFVLYVVRERGKLKPYADQNGEVRGLRLIGGFISLMSAGWVFVVGIGLYMMGVTTGGIATLWSALIVFCFVVISALFIAMNYMWHSEKRKAMQRYKKRSPVSVN